MRQIPVGSRGMAIPNVFDTTRRLLVRDARRRDLSHSRELPDQTTGRTTDCSDCTDEFTLFGPSIRAIRAIRGSISGRP
jgi:hypothetical protein